MLCGAVIWYQYVLYIFHKLSNNIGNQCFHFFFAPKSCYVGQAYVHFPQIVQQMFFFQFFFAPKICYVGQWFDISIYSIFSTNCPIILAINVFHFFFAPKSCYVGHWAGGRTIWGIVSKESFVKRKLFSSFFQNHIGVFGIGPFCISKLSQTHICITKVQVDHGII